MATKRPQAAAEEPAALVARAEERARVRADDDLQAPHANLVDEQGGRKAEMCAALRVPRALVVYTAILGRCAALRVPRILTSPLVTPAEARHLVDAARDVLGRDYEAVAAADLGHDRCAVIEGVAPLSDAMDAIAAAVDARGVAPLLSLGAGDGLFAAADLVADFAACYGLRDPVATRPTAWSPRAASVAGNWALDGADVDGSWDASRACAVDGLVDDGLRADLLATIRADARRPDAAFWRRGALEDVAGAGSAGACWGLDADAVLELCDDDAPPAPIVELQSRLAAYLDSVDPGAVVARLPEAALGPEVSPVTANAPIAADGDAYGWHVDADPLLLPPSPWTDFFGRYPNRAPGKPRLVSAVVYLAPDWGPDLGAPTVLLDPPTQDELRVAAAPGRVLLLDQDITHKIEAPDPRAGDRPRYSLVLKLVLHPKDDAAAPAFAPEPPVLFGSAARPPS